MIFSELYSAYFNAVAEILRAAVDHPLEKGELERIVGERAFAESVLYIEPALAQGRWALLGKDSGTVLKHPPDMPLTTLQKRWLKAVGADVRMRLFGEEIFDFPEVSALFTKEDILVFDRYADGDPYEDEGYIGRFRLILEAVKERCPLEVCVANRRGGESRMTVMPEYLEYSEKDDKFRLIASGCRYGNVINLGRILSCRRCEGAYGKREKGGKRAGEEIAGVTFELYDRRKALERVLMHFAHLEKRVERLGEDRYRVFLRYDRADETEMVIRLLSFGPMVRVTEPESFVELMRGRLRRQKSLIP